MMLTSQPIKVRSGQELLCVCDVLGAWLGAWFWDVDARLAGVVVFWQATAARPKPGTHPTPLLNIPTPHHSLKGTRPHLHMHSHPHYHIFIVSLSRMRACILSPRPLPTHAH